MCGLFYQNVPAAASFITSLMETRQAKKIPPVCFHGRYPNVILGLSPVEELGEVFFLALVHDGEHFIRRFENQITMRDD
jgi:hypothetical protein